MTEGIVIALIALSGVLVQSWAANRKTRQMNTAEHERGAEERKEAHEATLLAIKGVQEEVHGVSERLDDHTQMLVEHITDRSQHRREVA